MADIQYIGIKDLDEFDQAKVKSIVNNNIENVQRAIKSDFKLVVHIKSHKKKSTTDHKRDTKYSILLRAESAKGIFEAENSEFNTAEHIAISAFDELVDEIGHKLKR